MAVHNADIADTFNRLADLLEIEAASPFRVRAYRRAAVTIAELPTSCADMIDADADLTELPGVGDDLAGKIKEICETGSLGLLEEVGARTPASLAELTAIPGLGPKRVHDLHEALGVCTLAELVKAAEAGRIRALPRFSAKVEAKLLEEANKLVRAPRLGLEAAEPIAEAVLAWLRTAPALAEAVIAGSYRRRRDTIGDLDILAVTGDAAALAAHFTGFGEVQTVVSKGALRSTVILQTGLQVDLRTIAEESLGAALVYFTGSKAHNIAIRRRGQERGLKVSEYGVFRGMDRIAGRTEPDVYEALGLAYVEPELREDRGEVEAAAEGRLPRLVTVADIQGDLRARTTASDGRNSLAEMAEAARAAGLGYLAVADPGLDPDRLSAQMAEIDRLNRTWRDFRLLKGVEAAIGEDGRLDLPDALLDRLDVIVCAVRSALSLSRDAQTERIIRAMDNRRRLIVAHPQAREGYAVDLDRLVQAAKARGGFLEASARAGGAGLDDVHCRAAKVAGVKVAISTGARSTADLKAMRQGLDRARRGWLEPDDVLNARPWPELERLLAH
jgi:DNA polymerase (family 10)